MNYYYLIFFYLFLGRGEGREKERERDIDVRETYICCLSHDPQPGTKPATQACVLTRNRTGNLSACRSALNPLSHTSQGQKEIFWSQARQGLVSLKQLQKTNHQPFIFPYDYGIEIFQGDLQGRKVRIGNKGLDLYLCLLHLGWNITDVTFTDLILPPQFPVIENSPSKKNWCLERRDKDGWYRQSLLQRQKQRTTLSPTDPI